MITKRVIFYIPDLNRITNNYEDLFDRFDNYAQKLKAVNQMITFTLLCGVQNNLIFNSIVRKYPDIDFHFTKQTKNIFKQVYYLWRYLIVNKDSRKLIIPANNYDNYLSILFLRLFFKYKIQLALHGEIHKFGSEGIKFMLKQLWLLFTFNFSDSIRVVSIAQIEDLHRYYRLEKRKFVVCPIPIDCTKYIQLKKHTAHMSIGYVGRFHAERNPISLSRILSSDLLSHNKFNVYAIGSGPEKTESIKDLMNRANITLYSSEAISQSELLNYWPKIGVLLSTAPKESYGLAIREAVLNNTFVIAKRSQGAISLQKLVGEKFVRIYNTDLEAANLIVDFLNRNWHSGKAKNFSKIYEQEQSRQLKLLATSWSKLLD
jgi:glycosyltransferase involved in cell wall biosynthesis